MGMLTLVTGGQRSGKSTTASQLARRNGAPVVVVAPARAGDAELAERIARHQADRPAAWRTLETFDLLEGLREAGDGACVVVDALDTWLVQTMADRHLWTDAAVAALGAHGQRAVDVVLADVSAFIDAVADRNGDVIVIAGQPGLGPHALGAGARRYVDLHGFALHRLSAAADDVLLTVAGRTLRLPPAAPTVTGVRGVTAEPPQLRQHGDTQVPPGATDLAVNVVPGPPPWLADRLAGVVADLAAYPTDAEARDAAASRHGRHPGDCLIVNGAAEAFWLLATALRPTLAACVHPGFTEPEAALRAAGVPVVRVHRELEGWTLDAPAVPAAADLVTLGRPDNPTGVVDPVDTVARLARPGRLLVVDEAFAEFLPDAAGLAGRRDLPGLVCVRSLTKLWGLAGLRVGYLIAEAPVVSRLEASRQPWPCNSLALQAICAIVDAESERRERAHGVADERARLLNLLRAIEGVSCWDGAANFVLLRTPLPDLRTRLLAHGIAVRRGGTFPGLDDTYVRVAVRDTTTSEMLAAALRAVLRSD